jgi:quercetin dioxygenase-like cupin family protein
MTHRKPENTPADLAALHAAGALSAEERERFEAALRAGDEAALAELRGLEGVIQALAAAAGEVVPEPSVREGLLRRVREKPRADAEHGSVDVQVWRQWAATAKTSDLYTLFAHEGGWEETGVDGVLVRRLFVDRAANRMTAMFRMAPGAAYVPHRHEGPEECYVLEGDLHVGEDLVMRAGDYQRAPAGSHHGIQRTEGGCVLLVNCSLSDEVE